MHEGGVSEDSDAAFVLVGASDQAEVVLDVLERAGALRRVAAVLDASDAGHFLGRRLGSHEVKLTVSALSGTEFAGMLVIPAVGNPTIRGEILDAAASNGLSLATVVDRSAVIASGTRLGQGVVVAAGAFVGPQTTVGDGSIINVGAVITHHGVVGRVCHVGPRAVLAGNVVVGDGSTVGAGAVVRDDVHIGNRVTVGIAAAVIDDVESGLTVAGVPARPL